MPFAVLKPPTLVFFPITFKSVVMVCKNFRVSGGSLASLIYIPLQPTALPLSGGHHKHIKAKCITLYIIPCIDSDFLPLLRRRGSRTWHIQGLTQSQTLRRRGNPGMGDWWVSGWGISGVVIQAGYCRCISCRYAGADCVHEAENFPLGTSVASGCPRTEHWRMEPLQLPLDGRGPTSGSLQFKTLY